MNKWYGNVGFGISGETRPGIWEDTVVEHPYYGDVQKNYNARMVQTSDSTNTDVKLNNIVSIVADAFANEHFSTIRYVEFMGAKMCVTAVDVAPPRLNLSIGGVYKDVE